MDGALEESKTITQCSESDWRLAGEKLRDQLDLASKKLDPYRNFCLLLTKIMMELSWDSKSETFTTFCHNFNNEYDSIHFTASSKEDNFL